MKIDRYIVRINGEKIQDQEVDHLVEKDHDHQVIADRDHHGEIDPVHQDEEVGRPLIDAIVEEKINTIVAGGGILEVIARKDTIGMIVIIGGEIIGIATIEDDARKLTKLTNLSKLFLL